jgi:hypothetical protein
LVDDGVEEFSPYLSNLVYMGTGNHEQAVTIRKETDITQRFVDKANASRGDLPRIHRAGYTGWIRFMFQRGNERTSHAMKIEHGTGGNSPVTKGTIQTNRRSSRTEGATFFVSGHIHEKWNMPLVVETLNSSTGRVELREVEHIQLGSYKSDFRGAPQGVPLFCARRHNHGHSIRATQTARTSGSRTGSPSDSTAPAETTARADTARTTGSTTTGGANWPRPTRSGRTASIT